MTRTTRTPRTPRTTSLADAAIGPWEVAAGKGYNSRRFWVLTRSNPAWRLARESLLNASGRDERRFYVQDKADVEAARLNKAGT